jgi:hypothetical protein
MVRARYIFTPRAKSTITLKLFKNGRWAGSRVGIRIRLRLMPLNFDKRIGWEARIKGRKQFGLTSTVTEALEAIEKAAAVPTEEPTAK